MIESELSTSIDPTVCVFYDELTEHCHLIFEDWERSIEDWERSIERQARVLESILAAELPQHPLKILDCAMGCDPGVASELTCA